MDFCLKTPYLPECHFIIWKKEDRELDNVQDLSQPFASWP